MRILDGLFPGVDVGAGRTIDAGSLGNESHNPRVLLSQWIPGVAQTAFDVPFDAGSFSLAWKPGDQGSWCGWRRTHACPGRARPDRGTRRRRRPRTDPRTRCLRFSFSFIAFTAHRFRLGVSMRSIRVCGR
jgi:hypothetical protein